MKIEHKKKELVYFDDLPEGNVFGQEENGEMVFFMKTTTTTEGYNAVNLGQGFMAEFSPLEYVIPFPHAKLTI